MRTGNLPSGNLLPGTTFSICLFKRVFPVKPINSSSPTISLIVKLHMLARDIKAGEQPTIEASAIAEAGDRLAKFHLLLMNSLLHVQTRHDEEHLEDGVFHQKRDIDVLLGNLKRALA